MKLTSLKQKYSDLGKPSDASSDEYYPSLYLDGKQVDEMGVESVRVGTEMTMTATVRVSNQSESKDGHRSVSFEIIEAAVEPKEKKPEPASILFPNG